ncbi:MAG: IS200/IS605 family transposase [Melioribacteraceae bacterium]|nr:IS200/IS605 family transposase [Melioribacteraceae bacterium]
MSWIRIWVHLVFSTKNREPLLLQSIRESIIDHIKENAKSKNIWIDEINGWNDHIHILISLGKDHSISKIVQLIKGESSNWINKNKLTKTHFAWQDDYWAVSLSESHLADLRNYILNQEVHHKKITFNEEVENFMKKYGWKYLESN